MSDRNRFENLLVEHLPTIDRIVAALCRRYGAAADEYSDVASWVRLRLIEDDYGAFRKFRGESTMTTYLTVVVAMLFRDYRAQRWGRWRPSAAAQRQGRVGLRLETLLVRDRMPLRQAAEMLRSRGETQLSDRELADLAAAWPQRDPLRPIEVGAESLDAHESAGAADDELWIAIGDEQRRAALRSLDEVMQRLPVEDRVVLRLRFWEEMSIADIARMLCLNQKSLYRRLDRLLAELRVELEQNGVSREALFELGERSRLEAV